MMHVHLGSRHETNLTKVRVKLATALLTCDVADICDIGDVNDGSCSTAGTTLVDETVHEEIGCVVV